MPQLDVDVPGARELRCHQCGGAVPLATLTEASACPFCRAPMALPPHLLAELYRYRGALASGAQAVGHERAQAARWAYLGADSTATRGKYLLVVMFVCFGAPMLVAAVDALSPAGAPKAYGVLSQVAPWLMVGVIGLLSLTSYLRAQRARVVTPVARHAACPACGAPQPLAAGGSRTCAFCRAELVPSRTMIQHELAAIERQVRAERLARYRAERSGFAAVQRFAVNPAAFAVLSLLVPANIGAIVWLVGSPYESVHLVVLALPSASIGGLWLWLDYRKRRATRFRYGLDALAQQFHGAVYEGPAGSCEWLNRHWAGPFDLAALSTGPYQCGAALVVDGFPALFDIRPIAVSWEHDHRPARAFIVLGAWIPGLSDGGGMWRAPPEWLAHQRWFASAGFDLSAGEAGLTARASDEVVSALRREPEHALYFAPLLLNLARAARALGAIPAGD